jgi:hypothetical protein
LLKKDNSLKTDFNVKNENLHSVHIQRLVKTQNRIKEIFYGVLGLSVNLLIKRNPFSLEVGKVFFMDNANILNEQHTSACCVA